MIDMPLSLNFLPAFALSYLLHSSIWFVLGLLLVKFATAKHHQLQNYIWKAVLLGGLLSSSLVYLHNTQKLEILSETPIIQPPLLEKPQILASRNSGSVVAEEVAPLIDEESAPLSYISQGNLKETAIEPEQVDIGNWVPALIHGFSIFWLGGVLFLLLKLAIQHLIFFRKLGKRESVTDPSVLSLFSELREKARISTQLQLTKSRYLESPILIRGKEICLPEIALTSLPSQQLKAILAHELAHIIRKDHFWNYGSTLLHLCFFFQPLHMIVIKKLKASNELLCDTWAAEATGNRFALAESLLSVASWIKGNHFNYVLVERMAVKESELSRRIYSLINIPDMKKQAFSFVRAGGYFFSTIVLVSLLLPGFSFTSKELNQHLEKKSAELTMPLDQENSKSLQQEATTVDQHNLNSVAGTEEEAIIHDLRASNEKDEALLVKPLGEIMDPIALTPGLLKGKVDLLEPRKKPFIKLEERFKTNRTHRYFSMFKQNERKTGKASQAYLTSIYQLNKNCNSENARKRGKKLIRNRRGGNSLIFTLDYGTHVIYDTLANCVHPGPSKSQSLKNTHEIAGDFLDAYGTNGVKGRIPGIVKESSIYHRSKNLDETIFILELFEAADIRIDIKTEKEEKLIQTLSNERLAQDRYEFTWSHKNVKKGAYILELEVNGTISARRILIH